MGWNRVAPRDPGGLLPADHYYFAHSFAVAPIDPAVTLATTEYGETFTSAALSGNVVGVQFHPEKSQKAGLTFFERFFAKVGA